MDDFYTEENRLKCNEAIASVRELLYMHSEGMDSETAYQFCTMVLDSVLVNLILLAFNDKHDEIFEAESIKFRAAYEILKKAYLNKKS